MKKVLLSGQEENREARRVERYLEPIQRRLSPPCPWVVILGLDGSGKSSVLRQLEQRFANAPFAGAKIIHRRPGVVYSASEKSGEPVTHYSKPAHGQVKSAAKLAAMILDWLLGYWGSLVHQRAQGYLIFSDRHSLLDLLVDPLRYRYGGPAWLVRLAMRCTPMPDLVLLLDAPADVLQARKQELTLAEARRQRQAYLALIATLPNGQIIDASKPLNQVVTTVEHIISAHIDTSSPWQTTGREH